MKQHINTDVSDNIAVCDNQIFAEKQEYHSMFLKVNKETDKLKERLFVNLTGINNSNDHYPIIKLANGSNQGGTESVVSTNNQVSDQRITNVCRACENVSVAKLYRVK